MPTAIFHVRDVTGGMEGVTSAVHFLYLVLDLVVCGVWEPDKDKGVVTGMIQSDRMRINSIRVKCDVYVVKTQLLLCFGTQPS